MVGSRLTTALTVAALVVFALPLNLQASSVVEAFASRFSATERGDIALIGNTLMTCQASTTCSDALDGNGGSSNDNNDFSMVYVDVDGNGTTFASSSADLDLPNSAQVLFAGLYWGAESSDASRDEVKLKVPGGSYQTVAADDVVVDVADYAAFADVTSDVAGLNDPDGTYWVADVQATVGTNQAAGWTLVIAYEDANAPLRNLSVFDGYVSINTTDPSSITTTVSGFLTPPSGPITASVGMVTFEGDLGLVGDQFLLNGSNVSDGANPTDNVFNSTIADLGATVHAKNPDFINQLGFDIDQIDGTGFIPNNATSATLEYTTQGDVYYPTVLTFAVDVFEPRLTITKSADDANGALLAPGDEIEYTIHVDSVGSDTATDITLVDPIPAGTTYVANSTTIESGPNSGAVTDVAGDDVGEFDVPGNELVLRLGTGATSAAGGSLASAASTEIRFRVTLGDVAPGTTIENQAVVTYSGETIGGSFSASSDSDGNTPGDQPTEMDSESPPVAADDSGSTDEGTPVDVDVLANDDDPDGWSDLDPASVAVTSGPNHGDTSVDPVTGIVTYVPDPNYSGTDTFTYEVCDLSGMCDEATVDITIGAVADPPVAVDDSATTPQGVPVEVDVMANDDDPDGWADLDPATVTVTSGPSHGQTSVDPTTGKVTYTPDPGFSGPDSFIYEICDMDSHCDTATVDVDVQSPGVPPDAADDSASTDAGVPVLIDVLDNDVAGLNELDPTSVSIVSEPSHGDLAVDPANGEVTYTPDPGYSGPDSFTYEVCDTEGQCATAEVDITVILPDTAVLGGDERQPTFAWWRALVIALLPFTLLAAGLVASWRHRRVPRPRARF